MAQHAADLDNMSLAELGHHLTRASLADPSSVIRAAVTIYQRTADSSRHMSHDGTLAFLLRAMHEFRREKEVVLPICQALRNLARLPANAEEIVRAGGAAQILGVLRDFPADIESCEWAIRIFWNVVLVSTTQPMLFACEGFVAMIRDAALTHRLSESVSHAVLGFLRAVIFSDHPHGGLLRDVRAAAGDLLCACLVARAEDVDTLRRVCELLCRLRDLTGSDVGRSMSCSTGTPAKDDPLAAFLLAGGAGRIADILLSPPHRSSISRGSAALACSTLAALALAAPMQFATSVAVTPCAEAVVSILREAVVPEPHQDLVEASCFALASMAALPTASSKRAVAAAGCVEALVGVLSLISSTGGGGEKLLGKALPHACRALANVALGSSCCTERRQHLQRTNATVALRAVVSSASAGTSIRSHARAAVAIVQRELSAAASTPTDSSRPVGAQGD
jgi:hypothetical protein